MSSYADEPHDAAERFAIQRSAMIREQIAGRGIRDHRVIEAMSRLPRERFVPADLRASAYDDRALPIGPEQTISQPYMVAYMTEALRLDPSSRVLEIGTGSGYQAALLAMLAGSVDTIEYDAGLAEQAAKRLAALGITHLRCHVGDGTRGWPPQAPYDRIIVTAGAPRTPGPLLDQLTVGGRAILPLGEPGQQMLTELVREPKGICRHDLLACRFVKLRGAFGWPD